MLDSRGYSYPTAGVSGKGLNTIGKSGRWYVCINVMSPKIGEGWLRKPDEVMLWSEELASTIMDMASVGEANPEATGEVCVV